MLAVGRAKHQSQAEEMAIDTLPRGGFARKRGVGLDGTAKVGVAGCGLAGGRVIGEGEKDGWNLRNSLDPPWRVPTACYRS